jgi:RNase P/RNase MRP subunit POP5
MKPLKPSMREKKRYLLVKGKIKDIERAIFEGMGVLGISKTGLNWIKSDKKSAIISVNRGSVDSVKACFAIWPEKLWVGKVSGTLRGLGKKE